MGIYKRGKVWWIDYYDQGRRVRERVEASSKKVAQQALAARKGEIVQGRFELRKVRPGAFFKDFSEAYLEYSKANKRSWKRDRTSLRALYRHFENLRLNDITPWHIEKYKLKRKKEVSEASVNRELACLKHLFSMAIKWNKATVNPVKEVKLFRERNQRLRYLTIDEEKRLLDECNEYLRPIVITALHTGMRKSEILNLRWNQVDFERECVVVVYAKNDEVREIPMSATLTDCLTHVKVLSKGEYVFSRQEEEPPKSIRTAFENAVKRAELGDFHFHDIRHAFASRLIMSGVDLLTVKELLGHKTITMTMRYSHLSQEHKKKAICLLDGHNMDTNIDSGTSKNTLTR